MAFCPKCECEYQPGVKICPDCNCELVESLTVKSEEPLLKLKNETILKRFTDYLSYSGIDFTVKEQEDGSFGLFARKKEQERVLRAFSVFVSVETGNAFSDVGKEVADDSAQLMVEDDGGVIFDPESIEQLESMYENADTTGKLQELYSEDSVAEITGQPLHAAAAKNSYVPASEKAADAKGTTQLFLAFGILGLIAVIIMMVTGHTFLTTFGNVVLILMFIALICVGIWSRSVYKNAMEQSSVEDLLIGDMKDFLAANATKEDVLAAVPDASDASENDTIVTELQRGEWIVAKLTEQFPDADEALLRDVADKHYESLFPSEEE